MNKRSSSISRWVSNKDAFSTPFQFSVGGSSHHKSVIGGLAALLVYGFLALYLATKIYLWKTDPVYTQSIMKTFRLDNNKEIIPATTFIPAVNYINIGDDKNDNVQVQFEVLSEQARPHTRTVEAVRCSELLGERFDELTSKYKKPKTEDVAIRGGVM